MVSIFKSPKHHPSRFWAIATLILVATLGLGACSTGPSDGAGDQDSEASVEEFDGDLVFQDVNLNRAGDDGSPLWEVSAEEARYSRDRQKGQLKNPTGKLFQDGDAVYEFEAKQGFVEQNGIFLRLGGGIKVRDLRDGSTFQGEEGTWQPQLGVFDVQKGVVLKRGSDRLTAKSGQAFSKQRNFILREDVVLVSLKDKDNPAAGKTEMTARELIWQMGPNQVDAVGDTVLNRTEGANRTALRAERVVWQRKEQLIQAIGNARAQQSGSGSSTDIRAQRLVLQQKEQVLQAFGQVLAVGQNPSIRLQTERAVLRQKEQLFSSDVPTVMERYDCSSGSCVVSDRARGDAVEARLAEQVIYLRGNANVALTDPAITATSQLMRWFIKDQRLIADQPVTVVNLQDGVVLQGDYGDVNMKAQVANLVGNVRGRSQQNQSQMRAQRLAWAMKEKQVQLVGNVFYQQASPPLTSTGDRAAAAIKDGQFVLISGPGQRARTTLITEETQGGVKSESGSKPSPVPSPIPSPASGEIPGSTPAIIPPPLPARPGDLPNIPRRELLGG
ncbi:MAG: LPS export ABC transporter periplasmic protein LptC [Cyanobacteria bacterium P01_D01_bin.73]